MTGLRQFLGKDFRALEADGIATCVARGLRWGEGPAYLSESDRWIFSDIPNDRVLSFSRKEGTTTFLSPASFANGHFPLKGGGYLSCEHLTRSVTITDVRGRTRVLASQFQGGRLNSPNDVMEAPDGAIWFTDPTYGILTDVEGRRADPEQSRNRVYRLDPLTDGLTAEIEDLVMPNGLCLSPDASILFVADSGADMGPETAFDPDGPRDVFAYPLGRDGRVAGGHRLVCRIGHGVPDGIRCDAEGYLWVATGRGIECYDPTGTLAGVVFSQEVASNLAFGGAGGNEVMVTMESSAWLITT